LSKAQNRIAQVLDRDGKPTGEIPLPTVFDTRLRLDVIRKASIAEQSHRFQPQGRNLMAGKRTTAESFGVGRGISRVPRIGGHGPLSGTAAFAPGTMGGRSAFPPVTAKKLVKELNRKERRLALRSAIAATASDEIVRKRGHKFDNERQLPLVVSDEVEKLSKSSEAKHLLASVGVWEDVVRVRKSKRIKAGHRVHAVGPLIVLGDDKSARKALRNFEGVNVLKADDLSVEMLAPGTHPGRLTIWSESAVKKIAEKNW
jgi:large subunit ribosomal protein L4e